MGILDALLGIFRSSPSAGGHYKRIEKLVKEHIDVSSLSEAELEAKLKELARKIEKERGRKAARGIREYIKSGKWKKLVK